MSSDTHRARQTISSSDLPIATAPMIVGGDRFRSRISAAVTSVELNAGLATFQVEVRREAVTETGFDAQPVVTVRLDGDIVYAHSFESGANEVLYETWHDEFNVTPFEGGDHEICVTMDAPGYNPEYN